MPLTVGTAGHIDHGKTWLVRALTGKDTDRLPEERRRGISIDLGYAPLELEGGLRLSLVDVPGHERFVRTMIAGATGIDLFLLVVDAAEGARPQTHEHLAILRLLGVEQGVVAVTKADAVDARTLEFALDEARALVPSAPVVATSARTGTGLDELRHALAGVVQAARSRPELAAPRLFIDRAFSLRGVGTVVTGTLWSGTVGEGDELLVLPQELELRVRSVQVHDRPLERAQAGQRVAVALAGVERRRLHRGDVLVKRAAFPSSYRLDVALIEELEPIADGARVHVHHGTAEHAARVVRVGERFAQLRLASPAVAARGDRVVLRERTTLGGGVVLDPAPPRRASLRRLELLEQGEPQAILLSLLADAGEPLTRTELRGRGLLSEAELDAALHGAVQLGEWHTTREFLERERERVLAALSEQARQSPLDPGLTGGELFAGKPWATALLDLLPVERHGAKILLAGVTAVLGSHAEEAEQLEAQLVASGFRALRVESPKLARFLEDGGRLVRLGGGYAVSRAAYEQARKLLLQECERAGSITLARFRDLIGEARKPAQLLLERFDADGLTRRAGEARVLRRRARGD